MNFVIKTRLYWLLIYLKSLTAELRYVTAYSLKSVRLIPPVSFFFLKIALAAAAAAKSLQSCLTLCDPTDGSSPGSTVLGILQARTLEWVAISFSNA